MSWPLLLVSAALIAVAVVGTVGTLSRPRHLILERLSDPLEDQKDALLRSLDDLDEERATGALRDEDYRTLRADTERRAVAVLKQLAARDGTPRVGDGFRAIRPREDTRDDRPSSTRRGAAAFVAIALVAATVPLLVTSLGSRSTGQPITGDLGAGASSDGSDPLSFFEQRVADHPNDVAARLDLAYRYLNAGELQQAIAQYEAVLGLDPQNAEAHAELGFILFLAGKPTAGLAQVNRALARDPGYPEAMFIKGVILLRGLHEDERARALLEAYLRAAPFGAEREAAQKLLDAIDSNAAGSGT